MVYCFPFPGSKRVDSVVKRRLVKRNSQKQLENNHNGWDRTENNRGNEKITHRGKINDTFIVTIFVWPKKY